MANDLGISYNPDEEDYKVFFNEEENRAILYTISWGESTRTIAEATVVSCDMGIRGGNMRPKGRTIFVGKDEIEVNESTLRGASKYLENKETDNTVL